MVFPFTAMRAFGCVIGLVLLLGGGIASRAVAQAVQAVDDRGTIIRLTQPAQRIIALTPHLTELTFAAGAGAHLAGVARFSNYPVAATRLPVIGDDIARGIEVIAVLAGTLEASERSRAEFSAGLRALRARPRNTDPVRVFYEIWPKPLMTVSGAHIISKVIELCGGVNIFGALRPLTPEVSREALLAARPEIALGGSSAETASGFAARWAALPPPLGAVPAHHIAPDLIQRPTPRLLEGARLVCANLDAARALRR
ncbi:MAG: putative vitamin transport protein [Proteobacteria bacterium]|nr:putative vitamin transport protein [Pseudomonadota bacterium]